MVLAVTTITRSGKKNSTICPSNNANYCRDFFKDISAKLRFKKEKKFIPIACICNIWSTSLGSSTSSFLSTSNLGLAAKRYETNNN